IFGASYEDDAGPVVALSGRGQRLDKVLFTLLHEVAHVVRGDVSGGRPLIDEDKADELASSWIFDRALPKQPSRISAHWVSAVAADREVHPLVVIGRLQRSGRLPWRSALVRNAPNVTECLKNW
ncbi:MAG TPA: hypothetical protein VF444_23105, partial [Pseudonocardiaceae bacterium]